MQRYRKALSGAAVTVLAIALAPTAGAQGPATKPPPARPDQVVWLIADNAGTGTARADASAGSTPSAQADGGAPHTGGASDGAGVTGTETAAPSPVVPPTPPAAAAPPQGGSTGKPPAGGTSGSVPQLADGVLATYTLVQTIAAALQSSSDLQIAARNVEIDRKRADEAAAQARPSLRANASATRYDQATKISIGGGPPVEVQKSHSELLSLNLSDVVDLTGQIRATSSLARLQSLADEFTISRLRNDRTVRSQTTYFNLLRAQHQVQVAEQNLRTAQRQRADAQNLFAGGVGQKIDVYRAATQVAVAQQQVAAARNNEGIARANFNNLVGRPLAADTQVVDEAGVTVGADVSDTTGVGAGTAPAFTPFSAAPDAVEGINLDRSLATALARRPEVLAGEVNVRVAQTGVKLARAGLEPTLSLSAAGNYFPTTSFQTPRQRTAAITATVSLPLYDGGATRDRVVEARLRTENAQTSLESVRSDVALDVRQTYLNLSTAAGQIGAANTALQQATATRQLAQIRYQGQVGTYLEVTDAQAALVQAQNSQVNAVYDYLIARAQFLNALGTPETK